jgi:hypothetical protein
VINGAKLNIKIKVNKAGKGSFDATANVNLPKSLSPATVTLTIGNDTGTTFVTF